MGGSVGAVAALAAGTANLGNLDLWGIMHCSRLPESMTTSLHPADTFCKWACRAWQLCECEWCSQSRRSRREGACAYKSVAPQPHLSLR